MIRWMKWITLGTAIPLCIVLISGCNLQNKPTTQEKAEAPAKAKLDVTFKVTPKEPTPNMLPTLQATVMQSSKAVTDANVVFEVWKESMETHLMIEAAHFKDGIYNADFTLKDAGDYQVKAHVSTPGGMKQEIDGNFTVKKKKKCCEGH